MINSGPGSNSQFSRVPFWHSDISHRNSSTTKERGWRCRVKIYTVQDCQAWNLSSRWKSHMGLVLGWKCTEVKVREDCVFVACVKLQLHFRLLTPQSFLVHTTMMSIHIKYCFSHFKGLFSLPHHYTEITLLEVQHRIFSQKRKPKYCRSVILVNKNMLSQLC